MIDKEIQDQAWRCVPKAFREAVKKRFDKEKERPIIRDGYGNTPPIVYHNDVAQFLCELFDYHNLTSDAEPEEMLTVPRKKVQEKWQRAYEQEAKYSRAQDSPVAREELYYNRGIMSIIDTLFGSKCLPDEKKDVDLDKLNQKLDNALESETEVSLDEWINERNDNMEDKEHRNLSQETTNCDKSEEKELNLCEVLDGKDDKGLKIYSCISGEDELLEVVPKESNPGVLPFIRVGEFVYHPNGTLFDGEVGTCLLYPSRESFEKYLLDAKKAWMEWVEEQKPKRWHPKNKEPFWFVNFNTLKAEQSSMSNPDFDWEEDLNHFQTGSECQQAAEAVRECLMKFHESHAEK